MIIDCISDLHGHHPELEGGDLLIVAGDLTASDTKSEYARFIEWSDQMSCSYEKIVLICGNHDNLGQQYGKEILPTFCDYLCDSGTEYQGLKIWGSPWTQWFEGVNPVCTAFMCKTEEELKNKWALIPDDTDILVTHSPPLSILDETTRKNRVGSFTLRDRVFQIIPKLHVFGHIHEGYGAGEMQSYRDGGMDKIKFVNCAIMTKKYRPVNKPIRIELP